MRNFILILSLLLILLIFINSCKPSNSNTYDEALKNCDKVRTKLLKEMPNGFFSVGTDCLIGFKVPTFDSTTIAGKRINSENLKGKVSIINFWFESCPPCVAEIPGLNAIVEKYGADKINYIAIGKENSDDIEAFLKTHPWKFDHIPNGSELMENIFKLMTGYPTTFVLNRNLEIVLAFSGGKTDESAIDDIQRKLIPTIEKELANL